MIRPKYSCFGGTSCKAERETAIHSYFDRTHDYFQTKDIEEYERDFSTIVATDYAFAYAAGRMALFAILKAMDIGPGDEVIIPAFTCVVVANAIIYRGAKPIYVDIEDNFFNIDVSKVEEKISDRTKAIYAQHTFGIPCDVIELKEIAKKNNLYVIEDCALALGAKLNNQPVGSFGDAAIFSTDHSKTINTLCGGMAVTSDVLLASKLNQQYLLTPHLPRSMIKKQLCSFLLEDHFYHPNRFRFGRIPVSLFNRAVGSFFRDELSLEIPKKYSYPSRLSSPFAKIGSSQLKLLDENIGHRAEIAEVFERVIGWSALKMPNNVSPSWLRYSFMVKDQKAFVRRFKKDFELSLWFTSVVQGRSKNLIEVNYQPGSCPVAEHVSKHIVNFPTHQYLSVSKATHFMNEHGDWIKSNLQRGNS